MKTLKDITICILVGVTIIVAIGLSVYNFELKQENRELQARISDFETRTVRQQIMRIQRQVGCKLIDGKIGWRETMPKANAQSKRDEREECNEYAAVWNWYYERTK